MEKWYYMYSYWVVLLAILHKIKIINFSILPSVLIAIIGGAVILFLKLYLNIPMSLPYFLFMILLLHIFPLFLVPYKDVEITTSDIKNNLIVYLIYLLFVFVSNKNLFNVYKNVLLQSAFGKMF